MTEKEYRPDIDGLRAYAVLPVILFHFGITPFSGGFTGVDTFFVISGFLITQLIMREVGAGTFTFAGFYTRRARRLFPALFTVLAVTFSVGVLVLNPSDLDALASSTFYAIFSLSNFHFWAAADYFDTTARMKPLLHTWSLSVEEQFYLLWPATLVLCLKMKGVKLFTAILMAFAASMIIAQYWLYNEQAAAAFYLLPARICEFMVGAAAVFINVRRLPNIALEAMLLAGLALLTYAAVAFDETMIFPGLWAMVPAVGAAMALLGGTARFSGLLLRNHLAIWIGKTSYSSYLTHWPIIVFADLIMFRSPDTVELVLLLAATFGSAWLLYKFVETPFRRERPGSLSRPAFGLVCTALALALILPSASAWGNGGWDFRIPPDRVFTTVKEMEIEAKLDCKFRNQEFPRALFPCNNYSKQPNDIILFGDSHAEHLFSGFVDSFSRRNNIYAGIGQGCMPQLGITDFTWTDQPNESCEKHNQDMMDFLKTRPPSVVIFSHANRGDPEKLAKASAEVIERIKSYGHRVIYIGDIIRPGRFLSSCFGVPDYLISSEFNAERCVGDVLLRDEYLAYEAPMSAIPEYISASKVQCPEGRCVYSIDGRPIFRDDHHLTRAGSRYIVSRLVDEIREKLVPQEKKSRRKKAPSELPTAIN